MYSRNEQNHTLEPKVDKDFGNLLFGVFEIER